MLERSVARGVILTTLLGASAGLFLTWVWRTISNRATPSNASQTQ